MQNGHSSPSPRLGRVLLVEHDTPRRQHVYDLLLRAGYSVQAVATRSMALDALEHDWPQLILAGAQLGESTGFQLAQHIRRLHDTVPIVILGISAAVNGPEVQACLPADASDEALLAEVARRIMPVAKDDAKRLPCSVLVVDDEPKLRSMLKQFLEMHNFTVATAASGEEALEQLARNVPVFVLLDVGMDGMDGLLTLKKIKAMTVPTTVIMVTGNSESQTLKDAMALGAQDFINKPFSPSYLESVLLSKLYTG